MAGQTLGEPSRSCRATSRRRSRALGPRSLPRLFLTGGLALLLLPCPAGALNVDLGVRLRSFANDPLSPSTANLSVRLGPGDTAVADRSPPGFRFRQSASDEAIRTAEVSIEPQERWTPRVVRLVREPSQADEFVRTPTLYLVPGAQPITFETNRSASRDMVDADSIDRAVAYFSYAQAEAEAGRANDDRLLLENIAWNYTMTLANACRFWYDTCDEAARRCQDLDAKRVEDPSWAPSFASEHKVRTANIPLCLAITERVRVKSTAAAIEKLFADTERIERDSPCDPQLPVNHERLARMLEDAMADLAVHPQPWHDNGKLDVTLRKDLGVSRLKLGDIRDRCRESQPGDPCPAWKAAQSEFLQVHARAPQLRDVDRNLALLRQKVERCRHDG